MGHYMTDIYYAIKRYERFLKQSKSEDLTEISALRCLYRTGVDKHGRPVIVLIGKHFPANEVDLEKVSHPQNGLAVNQINKNYCI